ncbi:hypothetical protein D9613_008439 [Agrocybe pediades]|uniref:Uncharacterized protein n=1 Tax=Agrocybe pediades TaxID=84607 RepID=A0A8H4QSA0_9AGAR|nr:hypothetical protein D9613_008439 [Agrocybe pediades]
MLEASSQRIVWIKAVERMCYENTVYLPSYVVHDMGIRELEHAAMAPRRWELLTKSGLTSLEEPIPVSASRTINIPDHLSEPHRLFLIPGGRFLLVLQHKHLTLWDLAVEPIEPLHSVPTNCYTFTTHMSYDGRSALRILTITEKYNAYFLEMLEIAPWSTTPQFTLLDTLFVPSDYVLDFSSVCGDVVAVVHGPMIKLWNFVTGSWATWNTNCQSLQILMTEENITLIHQTHLAVWDIPNFLPDAQTEAIKDEPQVVTPPRKLMSYPPSYTHPESGYSCYGLCDWYTGSPQPLWFDHISVHRDESSDDDPTLHVSRFDTQESGVHWTLSFGLPFHPDTAIAPYRVSGQNIVIIWCTAAGIYCHTGAPNVDRMTTLCLLKGVRITRTSFCPISGRLVYITSKADGIRVIDFLPPV